MAQRSKQQPKKAGLQQPSLTGDTHLETSPINLLSLRDHARKELKKVFTNAAGSSKHLIWDPKLIGPLHYILTTKFLEENGINYRSRLESKKIQSNCDTIIFLTYPSVERMNIISDIVKQLTMSNNNRSYYLYLLPRTTYLCEKQLENSGVKANFKKIGELDIEWFPKDKDILTCALDRTLSSCLFGDISQLFDVAKALVQLQAVFGKFPIIRAKGDMSCGIVDIMRRLIREEDDVYKFDSRAEIEQCIIIDRTVDMITPCVTPRTYEALIDEVFNIQHSIITVGKDLLGKSVQKQKSASNDNSIDIVLNSSDNIFKQIRDTNFKFLGTILKEMASHVQTGYDERYLAKTTKQLRDYMNKFKLLQSDHQLVEKHVHIADYVATQTTKKMSWKRRVEHEFALLSQSNNNNNENAEDYLEELIGRGENLSSVLKFLILTSLCQGGISSKKYEMFKSEIIQSYGLEHLFTLQKLEEKGLLSKYETFKKLIGSIQGFNWNNIRKNFQLVKDPDEMKDIADPQALGIYDVNVILSGYAPLSARLVEAATRIKGWEGIESELEALPGKTYAEIRQQSQNNVNKNKSKHISSTSTSQLQTPENIHHSKQQSSIGITNTSSSGTGVTENVMNRGIATHKTVLIFFVGGVTYSEIAALRMLENRSNTPWKFIVATTNVANGDDIVKSFIDPVVQDISDSK